MPREDEAPGLMNRSRSFVAASQLCMRREQLWLRRGAAAGRVIAALAVIGVVCFDTGQRQIGGQLVAAQEPGNAAQVVAVRNGDAPPRDYPQDYHPELKQGGAAALGLLHYGPDIDECVKFEAEGLRIILPPGYPRQRPGTGVVTDFGIRG